MSPPSTFTRVPISRRLWLGTFTPKNIPGLQAWYRADQLVTFDGTTKQVSAWGDISGTGDANKNLAQATSARQPHLTSSYAPYNNQPCITFIHDNGSGPLLSGLFAQPIQQPNTFFCVGNPFTSDNAGVSNCFVFTDTHQASAFYDSGGNGMQLDFSIDGSGVPTLASTATTLDKPGIMIGVGDFKNSKIAVNQATPQVTGNAGYRQIDSLSVGFIALQASPNNFAFAGPMLELGFWNRVLSPTEIGNLLWYVNDRYKLTATGSIAPGPFDPSKLPGLALWLRGDKGVTLNGSTVSSWADQSGNGRNAVQATGGQQPSTTTLGGMPAISFNGSQALSMPLTFPNGAKTFYIVYQMSALPGLGTFYGLLSLATGTAITDFILSNIAVGYDNVTFFDDVAAAGTPGSGFNPTLDFFPHALGVTYNGGLNTTPGNYTASYDSAVKAVSQSSTVNRTATDLSAVGARLSSTNVISAGYVGSIAEVIVTSNVVSAANDTAVQAYLRARYGTP